MVWEWALVTAVCVLVEGEGAGTSALVSCSHAK